MSLIEPWMVDAACRDADPEIYYSVSRTDFITAEAKAVCARCPVVSNCLAYAFERNEQWGIWGGLTTEERLNVKRRAEYAARQSRADESELIAARTRV